MYSCIYTYVRTYTHTSDIILYLYSISCLGSEIILMLRHLLCQPRVFTIITKCVFLCSIFVYWKYVVGKNLKHLFALVLCYCVCRQFSIHLICWRKKSFNFLFSFQQLLFNSQWNEDEGDLGDSENCFTKLIATAIKQDNYKNIHYVNWLFNLLGISEGHVEAVMWLPLTWVY